MAMEEIVNHSSVKKLNLIGPVVYNMNTSIYKPRPGLNLNAKQLNIAVKNLVLMLNIDAHDIVHYIPKFVY